MKFALKDLRLHLAFHEIASAGRLACGGQCIEIYDGLARTILSRHGPLDPMPEQVSQAVVNYQPVPREDWPAWAIHLESRKIVGERGAGDTAARIFGLFGGEQFKKYFKLATGHDCGCCERQDQWNQQYPYC